LSGTDSGQRRAAVPASACPVAGGSRFISTVEVKPHHEPGSVAVVRLNCRLLSVVGLLDVTVPAAPFNAPIK
jgi:hypothetical protein